MALRTVPAQRSEMEGKTRRAAVRRKVVYEFRNNIPPYLFLRRKWSRFRYFSTFVEKQLS